MQVAVCKSEDKIIVMTSISWWNCHVVKLIKRTDNTLSRWTINRCWRSIAAWRCTIRCRQRSTEWIYIFFIEKFKSLFQLKNTNTGWLSANTYGQSFCGFLHRAKFPQSYVKVVDLNWHLHFLSSHCQLHDIHYLIQIGIRLVHLLEHCKNYLERYKSCLEHHMNCLVVVASSSLVVLPASK